MIIPPKWMRKINDFLILPWLYVWPAAVTICVCVSSYEIYIAFDESIGMLWLNFACLYGIIWAIPVVANLLIAFIEWICEKIHFIKLDKYYKKYPEKEKEMTEKLAKDFEDIAKALREEKDNDHL